MPVYRPMPLPTILLGAHGNTITGDLSAPEGWVNAEIRAALDGDVVYITGANAPYPNFHMWDTSGTADGFHEYRFTADFYGSSNEIIGGVESPTYQFARWSASSFRAHLAEMESAQGLDGVFVDGPLDMSSTTEMRRFIRDHAELMAKSDGEEYRVVTHGSGFDKTLIYDESGALDRTIVRKDAVGGVEVTTTTWADGRRTVEKDSADARNTFAYDASGALVEKVYRDGEGRETFRSVDEGDLRRDTWQDPNGYHETVEYDTGQVQTYRVDWSTGISQFTQIDPGSYDVYRIVSKGGIQGRDYTSTTYHYTPDGTTSFSDLTMLDGSHEATARISGVTMFDPVPWTDDVLRSLVGGTTFDFRSLAEGESHDVIRGFHGAGWNPEAPAADRDVMILDRDLFRDYQHFLDVTDDTADGLLIFAGQEGVGPSVLLAGVHEASLGAANFLFV